MKNQINYVWHWFRLIYVVLGSMFISSCIVQSTHFGVIQELSSQREELIDKEITKLLKKHKVLTAGAALIKNGKLIWTGYYGMQSPGVPASRFTQFDVASITKTVAAETVLRLVEKGILSLDESMSASWIDPDLIHDQRHNLLSPRMVLNHSTGFANWRFFSDGTLKFLYPPGEHYTYSGEGFEYLSRFVEKKLGRPFESLVKEHVFAPLSIVNASYSVQPDNFKNIVRALDKNGKFHGHYCIPNRGCREDGSSSAADDLRISIEDYARFLISIMNADGYNNKIERERNRVQIDKSADRSSALIICDEVPKIKCPLAQGYGLGWQIASYENTSLISHGGSDWSEVAQAYFYTNSKDGVMVFLNAPNINALKMMPEVIALLDPDNQLQPYYDIWLEEELGEE